MTPNPSPAPAVCPDCGHAADEHDGFLGCHHTMPDGSICPCTREEEDIVTAIEGGTR